ncbi:MAG: VOC family protein [Clostridia bacterium]|nr:VOC family protein [Clostridia bacterium]
MIQGVHHFAVIVSSLDSLLFYEKLGFKEFYRRERKYDTVVLLYGHGIQIEMFVDANHPPRSIPELLGVRHVALRVDKIEDTVAELGLEIGPIMNDWIGQRFCFAVDPDGNAVELHE